MRRFLLKFVLFSLPIVLAFGFQYLVLLSSGELENYSAAKADTNIKILGLAYSDPGAAFKVSQTFTRKPEVLAIGTSRAMQFRSVYFKDSSDFYNAGGIFSRINGLKCLQERMEQSDYYPNVILLPLDQFFFNEKLNDFSNDYCHVDTPQETELAFLSRTIVKFYTDLIQRKISVRKAFDHDPQVRGVNAAINNNGFRNDGSYQYASLTKEFKKSGRLSFKNEEEQVDTGTGRFMHSNEVYGKSVEALVSFIQFCQQNKIHPVVFLPPYPEAIYNRMLTSGNYGYIIKLPNELKHNLSPYGVRIYDFSSLQFIGAEDTEALDGYHGSEIAYLRIIAELNRNDSTLASFLDSHKIEQFLKNHRSPLQLN